jgi:hypothetical protein
MMRDSIEAARFFLSSNSSGKKWGIGFFLFKFIFLLKTNKLQSINADDDMFAKTRMMEIFLS